MATLLALMSESIYHLVSQSSILGMVSILVPLYAALISPEESKTPGCMVVHDLWVGRLCTFRAVFHMSQFHLLFLGFGASVLGLLIGNSMQK